MPRGEMLHRMTAAGDDLMEWFAALEVLNEEVEGAAAAAGEPVLPRAPSAIAPAASSKGAPVALRVASAFDVLLEQQQQRRGA